MTNDTRTDQAVKQRDGEVGMQEPKRTAEQEETLARAKRGEQSAFADLVREHQAMVFSLAHHFIHNRATAEDLAQEVFLHLYQNLAAIESPAHLKFWLRKVTGHRCIDHVRKKQNLPTMNVEDAPEPSVEFEFHETSHDFMLSATLRRMVATLPEKPRLVVTLRYQEDLDPTEIAEVLDMPLNTVKSHLRRSLTMLREKIGRSLGEIVA